MNLQIQSQSPGISLYKDANGNLRLVLSLPNRNSLQWLLTEDHYRQISISRPVDDTWTLVGRDETGQIHAMLTINTLSQPSNEVDVHTNGTLYLKNNSSDLIAISLSFTQDYVFKDKAWRLLVRTIKQHFEAKVAAQG